jgi:hypothetical protein
VEREGDREVLVSANSIKSVELVFGQQFYAPSLSNIYFQIAMLEGEKLPVEWCSVCQLADTEIWSSISFVRFAA